MAAVLLSNPGLPLAVLGNPGRRFKRRNPKNGSSDTGASSSGDSPNRNTTQTGGSSPGGASTGGVASGLGGAGTGGAATGGASTGGAGTVTLTISGSSSTSTGGRGSRGGNGRGGRKEKERPINISISNVGGRTDAGNVGSGDGPGAPGSGGRSKGRSSGGGGGGAAPDEPNNYSTGKDAKRLNHSMRKNPMPKRSVRFFLRRFKRNPHYNVTTQSAGGAMKQARTFSRNEASLRAKLASAGLDVISVSKAAGSPRKKHRKSAVATKSRKHHMARKTKRRSKRHARRTLHLSALGRVYRKKIGKHMHTVRIIASRRARRGKKRVRRAAVKWSGRRGTISVKGLSYGSPGHRGTRKVYFTNPKRRKSRSRRSRRNPGIVGEYVGGLTSAPNKVMALFKGPNAIKHAAFAAGGAVGTFMLGGIISAKLIRPLLEKVAPTFAAQVADPTSMAARIVGGVLPYSAAFAITKLFGKKLGSDISTALLLGGAVASAIELIKPGMVGDLLKKVGLGEIPSVGPALAGLGALSGPVAGLGYSDALAGYVDAPAYAGTAGYVDAPSYAGTGDQLAGYVQAQGYSGAAGIEQLAGTFLDDAGDNALNNNWLNTGGDQANS